MTTPTAYSMDGTKVVRTFRTHLKVETGIMKDMEFDEMTDRELTPICFITKRPLVKEDAAFAIIPLGKPGNFERRWLSLKFAEQILDMQKSGPKKGAKA